MIRIDKGSIEYVYIPVEVFGATPELISLLPYAMAFPPFGEDPENYVWILAEYEEGEVRALCDASQLERGDYRIKIRTQESPEAPIKDCGIMKVM